VLLFSPGKKHLLWSLLEDKRRRLHKTFLLQLIKNSQVERKPTNLLQVIVMPQLINWKQNGLAWLAWVVSLVSPRIATLCTIRLS